MRAENLLAMAYVTAGVADRAVWHAERCLALSETAGDSQTNFDRTCSWGGLARAKSLAATPGSEDEKVFRAAKAKFLEWLSRVELPEDRALLEKLYFSSAPGI